MKSMSLSVAHVRSSDASTMTPLLSRTTQPPRCSIRSRAYVTSGESFVDDCASASVALPAAAVNNTAATNALRYMRLCPPPCAARIEAPVDLGLRQGLANAVEPLFGQLGVIEIEILQVRLAGEPRQRLVRHVGAIEPELGKRVIVRELRQPGIAHRRVVQVQRFELRQLRHPGHARVGDA